jgi:chromosome segregation ATPase
MTGNITPETDALVPQFLNGGEVPDIFALCRKLECERDEARGQRDEWKAKYIQQNKDLGYELRDPNGTIWSECKRLQSELTAATEQRDEAREHLREIKEYGTEEINASVDLRQKLAQALVDLDSMQDQRDLAMKVIKRLECELAEAREALRQIWQSGDAFLPYVDEKTTNRWRKAAGWEETK